MGTRVSLSRRAFVSTAALAASGVVAACLDDAVAPFAALEPDPRTSGIEHVILVMMENRSFDHFLGWLPGADGRQAGLAYLDPAGVVHDTYPLAPDFQGCSHADPNHSYDGGRVEYNGGACDGWLRVNDIYSIGYYRQQDLAFLGRAAPQWTSFDRYFSAIMAATFPNRLYQHAGQIDRLGNSLEISTLPTIWDRLAARGIEGRYYYSDLPFLALWGAAYRPISRSIDAFFADCAAGSLPQVAFVEPRFMSDTEGTSGDYHPFGDIRAGETFLAQIYAAVTTSPAWAHAVLFINFDEWGGFFDHVPPPTAAIPEADRAAGNADGLRGFRTPALLISPFARPEHTSHVLYDHTSVLRLIEWRWELEPLTERDATANNLALELSRRPAWQQAPWYRVPSVISAACGTPAPSPQGAEVVAAPSRVARRHWEGLAELARQHGWAV